MQLILESKGFGSIKNDHIQINDGIEHENMPDLIDMISEELLEFSHWFDYTSAPSEPIKETATDYSSKVVLLNLDNGDIDQQYTKDV
jgi:hypothetical protein